MNVRIGVYWLIGVFFGCQSDEDAREDAEDWINGRDLALRARQQQRARDVVLAGGGEIA